MSEQTQGTAASDAAADAVAGRAASPGRWPAEMSLLTAWLLPATTARRTAHVKLRRAYAVHIISFALTLLLILVLVACAEVAETPDRGLIEQVGRDLGSIAGFVRDHPAEACLIAGVIFFGVELSTAALAVFLVPWGAQDEAVRASLANAFRRTWLQTSHAPALTLLIGGMALGLWQVERRVRYQSPPFPSRPPNPVMTEKEAKEFQAAMTKWQEESNAALMEYYRNRPWLVAHAEEVLGYTSFMGITWFLWATFRAVGSHREAAPMARPPLCEVCGYNLTAASTEGRCPECGTPVSESLGVHVRPGTFWQRRREVGFAHAWWRCCVDPIVRPAWFGRQVRTGTADAAHRWFLLVHLMAVFVVAGVGIVLCYVADTGDNPFKGDVEMIWVGGPLAGYLAAVCVVFFVLAAAGLVGVHGSIVCGRNLMSGTMQLAAYLSGYLLLWVILAASSGIAAFLVYRHPVVRDIARALHTDHEVFGFLCWLVFNLAWAAGYPMLVARGAVGLRYANR